MDLFLQGCQGVGLALAAGIVAGAACGAIRLSGPPLYVLSLAAVVAGAALFGLSLSAEDHPAWPGWLLGVPLAAGAFALAAVIVAAAGRRVEVSGSGGSLAAIVIAAGALLAALSLLVPPVALAALAAAMWLAFSRWRRSQRKYEGLRVLR